MFWKKKKQPEIPQVPAIPKVKELEGIEIGNIVCNRDEVSLNLFDKTLHNNSDASFFGGPASGMDFKAKLYSLRYFKQGKQIITITPYCSETDFKYMCQKIGGQIVKVNYDLNARLNIFDIYERKDFMGALLQEKIASLKALFRTMYPKMSYEEEMALGAALLTTYNNKGITVENDTIYRNGMQKCKAFPTMGDLYTTIKDMPEISQVLENFLKFLREYVDGEYFWYNSETTINPYNRYIVFDMERINMTNIEKEDKNFMYSACFEFINERLKQDADMQKVVVLRNMESMLIGKKLNMLISLCQNLHRNARDYNCAVLDFLTPPTISIVGGVKVSGVFFETIVRIIKQTGRRWPFEHGNIMKLAFEEVYIRLLAFSFTKYTNADLRLFKFASHYSTSSISTLGVAPYLPRRYPLRMFSAVRVEKSLMLYNSEAPLYLSLSTK